MFAKIKITGKVTAKTGIHIGTGNNLAVIGAADSPVIRDIHTKLPMIPATSLKGKIRTLLAKSLNTSFAKNHNNDHPIICRTFGSMGTIGRFQFNDLYMTNFEELAAQGIESPTEIKFENTINRMTSIANPRQIERAIRGTEYGLEVIYTVDKLEEVEEDIKTLFDGFTLLEFDYIGGSGTRGYGKVTFNNIKSEIVLGDKEALSYIVDNCNKYADDCF